MEITVDYNECVLPWGIEKIKKVELKKGIYHVTLEDYQGHEFTGDGTISKETYDKLISARPELTVRSNNEFVEFCKIL